MILITAFKPFNNRITNASLEVLKRLDLDSDYIKAYLTVSKEESIKELNELTKKYKPEMIISLGESGMDNEIVIEHKAHNLMNFKIKDESEKQYINELIDDKIKNDLETKKYPYYIFNNTFVKSYIKEGYDPGYFICNLVYFNTLKYKDNSLFIHLPLIDDGIKSEYKKMSLDLMVYIINIIIKEISNNGN